MHTLANKVSAKDRETAPKYYYKREERTTCLQKIKNALRTFVSFMFTQVGVIVLIGLYMVLGAFIFEVKRQLKRIVNLVWLKELKGHD